MPDSEPPLLFHEEDVAPGQVVRLTDDEAEHAGKSLRLKPGDLLTLANGKGGRNTAHVLSTKARHLEVKVDAISVEPRDSGPEIWLGAAIIRGPRFDLIVEKATELGVAGLIPVLSRYTEVRPGESGGGTKQERWRRLAIAAMKQSQRWYLPEIAPPTQLAELLQTGGFESVWVADPAPVHGPAGPPRGKTLLLVGPEGGWSEREREMFDAAGAVTMSLGRNRLRAETAAVTMLVLARAAAGDMGAAGAG